MIYNIHKHNSNTALEGCSLFHHITVLKEEATEGLHIKKDGIYVDCTLGGAGHSSLIASKLSGEGRIDLSGSG